MRDTKGRFTKEKIEKCLWCKDEYGQWKKSVESTVCVECFENMQRKIDEIIEHIEKLENPKTTWTYRWGPNDTCFREKTQPEPKVAPKNIKDPCPKCGENIVFCECTQPEPKEECGLTKCPFCNYSGFAFCPHCGKELKRHLLNKRNL